jgi:glycosyltransferase involved in cell wall biosynthesis
LLTAQLTGAEQVDLERQAVSRPLLVIALVEDPSHVCCRYRMAAYRPFLESGGHRLELRCWPKSVPEWLRLGRNLREADVVIAQRRLLPRWQLLLLRRAASLLLYDCDDALFLRDSYAVKGLDSARRRRRFAAIVRAADEVIVGNSFLRFQAARWTSLNRVHVIPTCVDPAQYPLAEHRQGGETAQLVWIGSSSTLRGLERARAILEVVGQCNPGLTLKLVSDRFLELRHARVIPRIWSPGDEAVELATADIGISWLPDDRWSQGKCGLKILQYMAAGLPVVANPVGVQADLVRAEENGLLGTTPEQWAAAVSRLVRDPALRRQMGQAGRRHLEDRFDVAAGARLWLDLLDRLWITRTWRRWHSGAARS